MQEKHKDYIKDYHKQQFDKVQNEIEYIGFLERIQNIMKWTEEKITKKCENQLKVLTPITLKVGNEIRPIVGKEQEAIKAYQDLQQCAGEFMGIASGIKTLFGTGEYVMAHQVEQCIADIVPSNDEMEKKGIRDCIDKTFRYTNKAFTKVIEENIKVVEEKLKKL